MKTVDKNSFKYSLNGKKTPEHVRAMLIQMATGKKVSVAPKKTPTKTA